MAVRNPDDEQVSRFEFETQAMSFDERASLGPEIARAATAAIVARVGLGAADVLLEIGAGTGELGVHLAAATSGYLGLDGSEAMLALFRRRAAEHVPALTPSLVFADANQPWPVAAASVRCVFLSRVFHLLDRAHVLDELERVKDPRGLAVVLGRRVRDPDAPAARLRRRLHAMLEDLRYEPRRPERATSELVQILIARGGAHLAPEPVARRTLVTSYRIELDAWRFKGGIAGISLPREIRELVLDDLETWARGEVSDLEAPVDAGEAYVIEGAFLP